MLSASQRQPHLLHVSAVDRHQTWSMDKWGGRHQRSRGPPCYYPSGMGTGKHHRVWVRVGYLKCSTRTPLVHVNGHFHMAMMFHIFAVTFKTGLGGLLMKHHQIHEIH